VDDPVIGCGGIVVEACNPKATAEALAAILLDEKMRMEMGRVMQRRIPNLYHKVRIKNLYEELYNGLMPQPVVERVDDSKIASRSAQPGTTKLGWWPRRHGAEYA